MAGLLLSFAEDRICGNPERSQSLVQGSLRRVDSDVLLRGLAGDLRLRTGPVPGSRRLQEWGRPGRPERQHDDGGPGEDEQTEQGTRKRAAGDGGHHRDAVSGWPYRECLGQLGPVHRVAVEGLRERARRAGPHGFLGPRRLPRRRREGDVRDDAHRRTQTRSRGHDCQHWLHGPRIL